MEINTGRAPKPLTCHEQLDSQIGNRRWKKIE